MTTKDQSQPDEAAFEEFLQGRGEMVKRLQALSQLKPSAALDAAILASAKTALAQSKAMKQAAANDVTLSGKPNTERPQFLSRLRIPLAMAASLMVAVLVTIMWHQSEDLPTQLALAPESTPAVASAAVSAAAPEPAQAAATPLAKAPKEAQTDATAKAKSRTDTANKNVAIASTTTAPSAPTPVVAAKPAAPVAEARSVATDKKADMPITASAGVANDALKRSADRAEPAPAQLAAQPAMSQSRAKVAIAEEKAATVAPAPASADATGAIEPAKTELTAVDKAKAWLAAIEEMSKYESRKEAALAQLERFEKSYPHYPVPEALRAKLNAAKN